MLSLWFVSVATIAPSTPQIRTDLSAFSSYFCKTNVQTLSERPFTDAQLELALTDSHKDIENLAKDFARENRHRGYAFGSCGKSKNWIVSTPSSAPPFLLKGNQVHLNRAALKHCRNYSMHAITRTSPIPTEVTTDLKLTKEDFRAVSVSCTPSDKPGVGPELLGLIHWDKEAVKPLSSTLAMFAWIQEKRRSSKLDELKIYQDLNAVAELSSKSGSLEHPHALLLERKQDLAKSGLILIGENRAIAHTYTELAELLWNSPEHRSLLLNAKSNAFGYAIKEVHGQKHLVLVLAKK